MPTRWATGPRSSSTRRARIALVRAPGPDGGPVASRARRARRATSSRCCRSASDVERGHDRGARATRSTTSRCRPARRAACRTSERPSAAAVTVRSGLLLVVESPATLSSMSHACRRRPRPGDRPPRRDRHDPSPVRPARPLDGPLLLPEGRHARLHRRGVRVPRRERDDRTSAAPTSGGSARRAPPASARSARSSGCRSRSSPTRTTRSPRRTARGSRSRTTGKTYWGTARTTFLVDPDGRIARAWPKVKPEGHAARGARRPRRSCRGRRAR